MSLLTRVRGGMNLMQIEAALSEGLLVCWQSPSHEVIRGENDCVLYIRSRATSHCIRLLRSDNVTMNGAEDDFFVCG
jgi:hypothetical protein